MSRQSSSDDVPEFWQPSFPDRSFLSEQRGAGSNKIVKQEDELEAAARIFYGFS
jgi:hypothetical protein